MTKGKINTKGFTLMEVLVSIAVVGILFTPMLTFFSHTTKTNVNAKKMQRVNTVAQSVMEEVRSYHSIADMVAAGENVANTQFERTDSGYKKSITADIKDSDGKFNNTKYYFVRKDLKSDGKDYTAKIEVDTTQYNDFNDIEVPVIASLGSGSTVMAAEADETMNVLYEYQSRYRAATDEKSISLEELANALEKTVVVKITDSTDDSSAIPVSDGMVRVTIYNEYRITDSSIKGCQEKIQSPNLYNEEVVYDKLKNIYLFYTYDRYKSHKIFQKIDINVEYKNHSDWKCDYGISAICQKIYDVDNPDEIIDKASSSTLYTEIKKKITITGNDHSNEEKVLPIFSNFNYKVNDGEQKTGNNMEDIVQKQKLQRLAKVTVKILDSDNKECTTITSTRGE